MGYATGDVSTNDPVLRDRRKAEGPSPQVQGAKAGAASGRAVSSALERRSSQSPRLLHQRPAATRAGRRHSAGPQEPILAATYPAMGGSAAEAQREHQGRRS